MSLVFHSRSMIDYSAMFALRNSYIGFLLVPANALYRGAQRALRIHCALYSAFLEFVLYFRSLLSFLSTVVTIYMRSCSLVLSLLFRFSSPGLSIRDSPSPSLSVSLSLSATAMTFLLSVGISFCSTAALF